MENRREGCQASYLGRENKTNGVLRTFDTTDCFPIRLKRISSFLFQADYPFDKIPRHAEIIGFF
jgi:hypothetical protein